MHCIAGTTTLTPEVSFYCVNIYEELDLLYLCLGGNIDELFHGLNKRVEASRAYIL